MKVLVFDKQRSLWVVRPDLVKRTQYETKENLMDIMEKNSDILTGRIIDGRNHTIFKVTQKGV